MPSFLPHRERPLLAGKMRIVLWQAFIKLNDQLLQENTTRETKEFLNTRDVQTLRQNLLQLITVNFEQINLALLRLTVVAINSFVARWASTFISNKRLRSGSASCTVHARVRVAFGRSWKRSAIQDQGIDTLPEKVHSNNLLIQG